MNREIKQRLINRVSNSFSPLTPVTKLNQPILFMLLNNNFLKFERWPETHKVERSDFEAIIKDQPELINAYLDNYCSDLQFYKCVLFFNWDFLEYYILKKDDNIILFSFNRVACTKSANMINNKNQ